MIESLAIFLFGALIFLAYKVGYEEGKSDEQEKQRLRKLKIMTGKDDGEY